MNIVESFATYMQTELLLGTVGTNIKIGGVASDDPSSCWWVVMSGGTPGKVNKTGELLKNYTVDVYYRSMDQEDVYNKMQELEELINRGSCDTLTGFDTIEMKATLFPADQDIDNQERTIGLLQITIQTYYKE